MSRWSPETLDERLQKYIDDTGGPDACWLWRGALNDSGYGMVNVNGRARRVSRVIMRVVNPKVLVIHHCDTPACCNPAHLFLGDHAMNMRDMARKGRANGGPILNLSPEEIVVIRGSKDTQQTLARRFGCSQSTISNIKNGVRHGTR